MFGITTALGVDIGERNLRVVAVRAAGAGCEILRAWRVPLSANHTMAEVATQLSTIFDEAPAQRRQVACGIPASGCAVKIATLPPAKPAELAQVAQFEAESQIPLPLAELAWGYTLTPDPSGQQHTVIAGARRALIDEYLNTIQTAGGTPVSLLPVPLAAAMVVAHPTGGHLIIRAGDKWTDICLFDGERLLGCRSVSAGLSTSEGWGQRIAREMQPWLAGPTHPEQITLLGDSTPKLMGALQEAIGRSITRELTWEHTHDPHGILQKQDDSPTAYATAVGLALAALHPQRGMNLLPAQITESYQQNRKLAWLAGGLCVALCLLAPAAFITGQQVAVRHQERQAVSRELQKTQRTMPAPPSAGIVLAQRTLDALEKPENQPLEILSRISEAFPEKVTLLDFSYDRGKSMVTLKGQADVHRTVAATVAALTEMPIVERAQLDYATVTDKDGVSSCDFQITCILHTTPDQTFVTGRQRAGRQTQSGTKVQ